MSHIIKELKDYILTIKLNRPEASNAISVKMINELCETLNEANWDNTVRVVVLTGNGKNFCAGGDIKDMEEKSGMFAGESNELRERYQRGIQRIPQTIEAFSKPILAMVNGAAIGAGCDLAAMCDIRIGCEFSKFGETFSKLALVPGDGGTFFLPRVVGYAKAMEMFLTGKIYSANESLDMGLLNYLHKSSELESKTIELAKSISNNSPIALSMTKKALKQSKNAELTQCLDMLAAFQGITQRTEDHFKGLSALKTKSQAEFTGK